jgi:hypothetical protein
MTHDEVTMKDKLAVLRNDQQLRKATYHSLAHADADLERGGRYASLNKLTVTGTGPSGWAPQQPANSFWKCDPVPAEMPLGYDINAIEPTGEPHEVAKSIRASSIPARIDDETHTSFVVGDGRDVGVKSKSKRWRRI